MTSKLLFLFSLSLFSKVELTSNDLKWDLAPDHSIEVSFLSNNLEGILSDVQYSKETNTLEILSSQNIRFVRVTGKNGVLVYQIPINSKNIAFEFNEFPAGDYRIFMTLYSGKLIEAKVKVGF